MKLTITLAFEVDGTPPTEAQRDAIEAQIVDDWPQFVYSYGDEEGALIVNFDNMEWVL